MIKLNELSNKIKTLPSKPGVYQFFDVNGKIIYVGKAKNLKQRVSSYFYKNNQKSLKLEVVGLMSLDEAENVAKKYLDVHNMVKELVLDLTAPFMTMAFMALLVIPELKIGDKGLFDVTKFDFTSLFVD